SASRNPPIDPRHEPRQPDLGRAPDPRRTAQTRHRCGSDLGREIYGKTPETSIARMEDVLAQPRRWNRRNGSLCRSDAFVSASLWLVDLKARHAPDPAAGGTGSSDGRKPPQLPEACGWDGTPEYLVRDHDSVYGAIFTRRVRAMSIRDRPIAPRSPWQ